MKMHKILYILLFISFSLFAQGKTPSLTPFHINTYFFENDSNYTLYLTYKISYNNLVFVKDNGFYNAGVNFSIESLNNGTNKIREYVKKDISIIDYDKTKSHYHFLEGVLKVVLEEGSYSFNPIMSINYTDQDLILPPIQLDFNKDSSNLIFPPIIVYPQKISCNGKESYKVINYGQNIPFGKDPLGLLVPLKKITSESEYSIVLEQKDSVIDTLYGDILNIPYNDLVECENDIFLDSSNVNGIKVLYFNDFNRKLDEGEYKISLTMADSTYSRGGRVVWFNKPFSLSNMDFAIEILSLAANDEEIAKIRDSDSKEQYKQLKNFWDRFDPDRSTKYNELMAEFYQRSDKAIRTYSTINKKNGAFSDRGKIFIKYGEPDEQRRDYSTMDSVREIWIYKRLKKEFIFVDRNGLGNFVLLEE